FILAGSANTPNNTGTGYAVVLGNSGPTDPLRLVKYSAGLGSLTNIISSNTTGLTDFGTDYLSVKVTYIPSTDTWELFVRNDGATAFADPNLGTLTSQGTANDNTYTSVALDFLGGYWQGSTAGAQAAFFDNVTVAVATGAVNSANSDIIADAGFSPATNLNYALYQDADITDLNSLEVARFTLRDGGGAADADAVGTTLSALSMSLTNSANIRRVALYDGTTELGEVAGGATVTFTGLSLLAADDATKTFSVRVTFNTAVTDNDQFQFTITGASAEPAGSGFAAANAGGASSSIAGDDNRIEVIADRLAFVQNTTSPTGVSTAMTPAPTVSANDVNANRDLDFTAFIDITSTGTLLGSPVSTQAVAGLSTFSGAIIHTATGTGLQLTAASTGLTSATSNLFDIQTASSATDYFRSKAPSGGNWGDAASWESSADNSIWIPATLVPDENANTISILNGHTVTISTAITADQVVIENGGLLTNTAGVFTVNNGTGDDIIVQNGGIFNVASSGGPVYTTDATAAINTGGTLRISRTGYTGNGTGMNSANYIYQTGSIAEYALTSSFSSSNVTFFPNVDATTIPIFRTTGNLAGVGAGSPTTFNGIFEANSNVTFTGAATKTFRNGIRGTGDVSGSGSGKFIINGITAELGGAGALTVPTATGLEIGAPTVVTVTSNKTITGDVTLLADGYVELGANNLTITGLLNGGAVNAYVRTTGAGALVRSVSAAGDYQFPVGSATKYQECTINFAAPLGAANTLAARFVSGEGGLNGLPLSESGDNINRISPEGFWEVNAGAPFADAYTGTFVARNFNGVLDYSKLHLLKRTDAVSPWTLDGTHVPTTGTNALATLQRTGMSGFSQFAAGGELNIALPVKFSNVKAYQQGSGIKVEWSNLTESNVADYKVERSIAGQSFAALTTVLAAKNDGGRADYSFIDALPVNGVNLYRIQATEADGQKLYSVIVRVDTRGGITTITVYPNPVTAGQLSLQATELPKGLYNVQVYNAAGQQVHSQQLNHNGGSVTEMIQLPASLRSGMYNLLLSNGDMKLGKTFIVR
ncbi:MAG: T9SS type A sorting domain-containing protein, partial [Saprospiraceae bacterium]|nr:T9SS type A sorting domain-containing protein [Saprospiraceae bacterium]